MTIYAVVALLCFNYLLVVLLHHLHQNLKWYSDGILSLFRCYLFSARNIEFELGIVHGEFRSTIYVGRLIRHRDIVNAADSQLSIVI